MRARYSLAGRRCRMAPKVIGNRTEGRKKALSMSRGFKATHGALPLSHRLVRVFCSILQAFVLSMLYASEQFSFRCSVTGQLVSNDDAWNLLQPFKQLTEEFLGCLLISPPLNQNSENSSILIDGSPEGVRFPIDGEKDARPACHVSPVRGRERFTSLAYCWPNLRHHCRIVM